MFIGNDIYDISFWFGPSKLDLGHVVLSATGPEMFLVLSKY